MADPFAVTMELPVQAQESPLAGPVNGVRNSSDAQRLLLHAELTRAAIPPHPDDRRVIRDLAQLDGGAVGAIVRWLQQAGGTGAGLLSPPDPAKRIDPRLLPW
ncbi:hypothetical protein ABZW18_22680 [Streptomyces sp. NPDC004647]|uniref:hypothetical protein n=1 Tax=Streptomyces sp. NPDC004647 TaxID=3154671 RepID=UPI0033A472E0